MDLQKITAAELKDFDRAKLNGLETDIRREMAMLGMDVYAAQGQSSGKKRALKKSLARVLTVKNQK